MFSINKDAFQDSLDKMAASERQMDNLFEQLQMKRIALDQAWEGDDKVATIEALDKTIDSLKVEKARLASLTQKLNAFLVEMNESDQMLRGSIEGI